MKKCLVLLLFLPYTLMGQQVSIANPSFEDVPGHSRPPQSWFFCGPANTSPPDVNPTPMFGVMEPAKDGDTYVGLITREDGTVEAIGQALQEPLQANQCYQLRIFSRRSTKLHSRVTYPVEEDKLITAACRLRVFGTNTRCEDGTLLAQSEVVSQPHWRQIELNFSPDQDYSFLVLQAYFAEDDPSYGNLQLDQLSVQIIDCKSNQIEVPLDENASIVPQAHTIPSHKIDLGLIGKELNCSLSKSCRKVNKEEVPLAYQKWPQWYQLAHAIPKMDAGTQLEVGIQSSSDKEFDKMRKRWLKRWTSATVLGQAELVRFTKTETMVEAVAWDYIQADEPYAYRFRKNPTFDTN